MDLSILGRRLKAERRQRSLTLEKMAEQLGLSRNFLWEIESGRKAPALGTLFNIAITLNISIDYLMGVSDENRRPYTDSAISQREALLSQILKLLNSCDQKELLLIRNVLTEFDRYAKNKSH